MLLRAWENRYLRWLRLGLHGSAVLAAALAVLAGLSSALGLLASLGSNTESSSKDNILVTIVGGVGAVAMLEWFVGSIVGLLMLRIALDFERRLRGEPPLDLDKDEADLADKFKQDFYW